MKNAYLTLGLPTDDVQPAPAAEIGLPNDADMRVVGLDRPDAGDKHARRERERARKAVAEARWARRRAARAEDFAGALVDLRERTGYSASTESRRIILGAPSMADAPSYSIRRVAAQGIRGPLYALARYYHPTRTDGPSLAVFRGLDDRCPRAACVRFACALILARRDRDNAEGVAQ